MTTTKGGETPTTITIPKYEFDELEKKCKKQEHKIREQKELIEKLSFGADVFEGWRIRLTQKYLAVQLHNRELLIERNKSIRLPEGAPAELIASQKANLEELQQGQEKALEQCNEWEDAWKTFADKNPKAAEHILAARVQHHKNPTEHG